MHGALYMPRLDAAYFVLPVCSLGYLSKRVCNIILLPSFFLKNSKAYKLTICYHVVTLARLDFAHILKYTLKLLGDRILMKFCSSVLIATLSYRLKARDMHCSQRLSIRSLYPSILLYPYSEYHIAKILDCSRLFHHGHLLSPEHSR